MNIHTTAHAKRFMTSPKALLKKRSNHSNFTMKIITTWKDTSGMGIGAILLQTQEEECTTIPHCGK